MRSKVSSDWLPSYIKAMRPVLEIFKMDGYVSDSPRIRHLLLCDKYLGFTKTDIPNIFIHIAELNKSLPSKQPDETTKYQTTR